jgi:hypothetical protein
MAPDSLRGRRLPDVTMGDPAASWQRWKDRQAGDYMRVTSQNGSVRWWICDPLGRVGQIGGQRVELQVLEGHMTSEGFPALIPVVQPPVVHAWEITEHEDGSISVLPSIMDPTGWHGYLTNGVWRSA